MYYNLDLMSVSVHQGKKGGISFDTLPVNCAGRFYIAMIITKGISLFDENTNLSVVMKYQLTYIKL